MAMEKIQNLETNNPYPDLNYWRPTGRMRWFQDQPKKYEGNIGERKYFSQPPPLLQQEFYNFVARPNPPENIWITVPTVEEK